MRRPMKSLAHGLRWAHNTASLLSRKSNPEVMADIIEDQLMLGVKAGQLKDFPYPKPFFTLDIANEMVELGRYERMVKLMEMLDILWDERGKYGVGAV